MLVSTAELIAELVNCCDSSNKPVAAERGRYGGTFVCKELVYAYAMWVSADYHPYLVTTAPANAHAAQR